jgi:hypothetical protein
MATVIKKAPALDPNNPNDPAKAAATIKLLDMVYCAAQVTSILSIVETSSYIFVLCTADGSSNIQLARYPKSSISSGGVADYHILPDRLRDVGGAVTSNIVADSTGTYLYVAVYGIGIQVYDVSTCNVVYTYTIGNLITILCCAGNLLLGFRKDYYNGQYKWDISSPSILTYIPSTTVYSVADNPGTIQAVWFVPFDNEFRAFFINSSTKKEYLLRYTEVGDFLDATELGGTYSTGIASPESSDNFCTRADAAIFKLLDDNLDTVYQANIGSLSGDGQILSPYILTDQTKKYLYLISGTNDGIARFTIEPMFHFGIVLGELASGSQAVLDSTNQVIYMFESSKPAERNIKIIKVSVIVNTDAITDLNASVSAATESIILNWTNITVGETQTDIYRSSDNTTFIKIGSVSNGVSTFTDASVVTETTYQYYVVEIYNNAQGAVSNIVEATAEWATEIPDTPTSPTGSVRYDAVGTASGARYTLQSPDKCTIYWEYRLTDNCGNTLNRIDGFKVYRSSGGLFELVATLGSDIREWQDSGLNLASNYRYYIISYNNERSSDPSAYYTIDLSPLRVPTAPVVSKGVIELAAITISWELVSGVTSYKVYRKNSTTSGTWRLLATKTATEFSHIDSTVKVIKSSRLHAVQYKVLAANSYGDSMDSNTVEVTVEE